MGRKQIKFSEEIYERLRDEKRQHETWDGLAVRLLEEHGEN